MYSLERFNIARALATCLEKSMEPRFSNASSFQFIIPSHHIIQLLLHLIKENVKLIVKVELERIADDENLKHLIQK